MSQAYIWTSRVIIAAVAIAFLWLLHQLSPIITPFAIALLIAYLCDPLVDKLRKWDLSRTTSAISIVVILVMVLVLMILILTPIIQRQITNFLNFVPEIITWLQDSIMPWLADHFGINEQIDPESIKKALANNVTSVGGASGWLLQTAFTSGKALFEILMFGVLTPIVLFYALRDWDFLLTKAKNCIPPKKRTNVLRIIKECDVVLSAFFRGQLLVMLAVGLYYSLTLTLIGLQTGILIGVTVGIITIVPYFGFMIGIVLATIAALIQFGTFSSVLWVWGIFLVGHGMENLVLTPILIGDRIGLHPVLVIFAVLAGGTLFGFLGILLALPVAAVLMVLFKHFFQRYVTSAYYNK